MKGWVYIISNKAMPDLVKVGFSTKDPQLRAQEFDNAGLPHSYLVEYWMLIEDPYQIEQKTHQLLSSKREAKEWFKCTAEEAIAAIKQIAGSHAILEDYTRAERAKAEALYEQEIQEQEARLAQEKAEKDIEDRLRNEESAICEKFQRQIETRFPSRSGIAGVFFRDYFEKKQKQSTDYHTLEKRRDEELAAVRWRFVSNAINKKTSEKTQSSSDTTSIQANISQKVENYNEVIRLKPDDVNAYYNRGLAYANLGQYQRAIENYDEAIRLKPDNTAAYNNRGLAYDVLGRPYHTDEDYNRLPHKKLDFDKLAKSHLNMFKQYQRAIEDYNEAIRLKPDYANAYLNRGRTYANLNQYQRAIQDYDEAIRLKPDYADAYCNRGIAYANLNQYQRVIEDYSEVIRLKPDYADAYLLRGNAYRRLHNDIQFNIDLNIAARLGNQTAQDFLRRRGIDW
jgi:tetratricopeptide (TPR) repeat protein